MSSYTLSFFFFFFFSCCCGGGGGGSGGDGGGGGGGGDCVSVGGGGLCVWVDTVFFRAYRVVKCVIIICKSFCIPQISDQYNNIVLIVNRIYIYTKANIYIKCSENSAKLP